MSGPLENSVTLEDVIAVVAAKRVPLAAELAGYLALEMAEGAGTNPGALDPAQVYVSDEGSVALVRAKKDGDAEASVRALLGRLLEAGGTATPALGLAAKKPASGGAQALARELEAALIPVNRAAGRRALARLAREVKRVTHGVGRNASIPPAERGARGSSPDARRGSAPGFGEEESTTAAKQPVPEDVLESAKRSEPPPAPPEAPRVALQRPDSSELPTMQLSTTDAQRLQSLPEAMRDSARPKADEVAAVAPVVPPPPVVPVVPPPPPTPVAPDPDELHPVEDEPKDEVDQLLSSFAVSGAKEDRAVSHDLKALVGLEPTPPPLATDTSEGTADESGVDDLLAISKGTAKPPPVATAAKPEPPPPAPSKPRQAAPPKADKPKPAPARAETPEPEPPSRRGSYADDRSLPTSPSRRRVEKRKLSALDAVLGVTLAVLLGAGGYLLAMRFLHPTPTPQPPEVASAPKPPEPPKRACKATITVENAPDKAEILLRVGQAPVEIDHMPVGTRLEFVATADGYAPKRTVVPAGGSWEKGPDGKPRYELAVQLDPSRAKGGVDAWPPVEPGSAAGGEGPPGVVRVVSSPKGAEVWLLVGLGPEAAIERLPCSGDAQLLVAGAGSFRKRLVVRESNLADVAGQPGQKSARISAK